MNLRAAALVAPAVAMGLLAVSVVSAVNPLAERIALEIAAVACVAAAVWRAAVLARDSKTVASAISEPATTLRVVSRDRRRPIFDRDSGAYSAWYFRLRVEEEIARAERFGERFSIVSVSGTATAPLDPGRIAAQWLREVDFAGNLGSAVAIALPKTDRRGAQVFVDRLTPMLKDLDIRIGEYPADGRTLDALLGEDEWRSSQPPEDVAA